MNLAAASLLEVWEQGQGAPPAARALALLAWADPECSEPELAAWPLGERDHALLTLRAALFGPRLEAVAGCPGCGERVELALTTTDLTVVQAVPAVPAVPAALEVTVSGRRYPLRRPTSADLLRLAGRALDATAARRELLTACVEGDPGPLDEETLDAIEAQLALADPQADTELALTCPVCRHEWLAGFSITDFLWAELDTWAERLLAEVHTLASAYGWREGDILALSPARRQRYLQLIWQHGGGG